MNWRLKPYEEQVWIKDHITDKVELHSIKKTLFDITLYLNQIWECRKNARKARTTYETCLIALLMPFATFFKFSCWHRLVMHICHLADISKWSKAAVSTRMQTFLSPSFFLLDNPLGDEGMPTYSHSHCPLGKQTTLSSGMGIVEAMQSQSPELRLKQPYKANFSYATPIRWNHLLDAS